MEKLRGTRASQDKRERDDNNARGRKVAIKLAAVAGLLVACALASSQIAVKIEEGRRLTASNQWVQSGADVVTGTPHLDEGGHSIRLNALGTSFICGGNEIANVVGYTGREGRPTSRVGLAVVRHRGE